MLDPVAMSRQKMSATAPFPVVSDFSSVHVPPSESVIAPVVAAVPLPFPNPATATSSVLLAGVHELVVTLVAEADAKLLMAC